MSLLLTPLLASVLALIGHQATAQSGLQGIPGYLPKGYPTDDPPEADLGPNDVYQRVEVSQRPEVRIGDVVLYPGFDGFEHGQDGELPIYEVVNLFDIQQPQQQQQQQQQHQQRQQYRPFSSIVSNHIGGPSAGDGLLRLA